MNGVILDAGSFDQNDLITSSLEASLENWHWHRSTLPNQTMARIADMNVIVTNKVAITASALEVRAFNSLLLPQPEQTISISKQPNAKLFQFVTSATTPPLR